MGFTSKLQVKKKLMELDTLVMIQTKFGFHWSSTFRGEDFSKSLQRTTTMDAK